MSDSKSLNQEIIDYIIQAQRHGMADFEIKQNLLNAGWDAQAVEHNYVLAKAQETRQPVASSENFPINVRPLIDEKPSAQANTSKMNQVSGVIVVQTSGMNLHNKLIWITPLCLIFLGASAYAYYHYGYVNPQKTWNKFIQTENSDKIFKTDLTLSYKPAGVQGEGNPAYSLTANIYSNLAEPQFFQQKGQIKLSGEISGITINTAFNYILLSSVLYIDTQGLGSLLSMFNVTSEGWKKINLGQVQKYAEEASSASWFQNDLKIWAEVQKVWADFKTVTVTEFLEKEELNGVKVFHLKNKLDNQALANTFVKILKILASASGAAFLEKDGEREVTALLKKFQVKEYDVWIGREDFKLYQMYITIAAPSTEDLEILENFEDDHQSAKYRTRDGQRLADIRHIASVLDFYYDNNGGYPEAQNGQPLYLSPTYIGAIPTAPTPPDGTCSDYYNTYWYEPTGTPKTSSGVKIYQNYSLTFCLGKATEGLKGGLAKLTERGITEDGVPCAGTQEQCYQNNSEPDEAISEAEDRLKAIENLKFDAEIKFNLTFKDYGKTEDIVAPVNSTDLIEF